MSEEEKESGIITRRRKYDSLMSQADTIADAQPRVARVLRKRAATMYDPVKDTKPYLIALAERIILNVEAWVQECSVDLPKAFAPDTATPASPDTKSNCNGSKEEEEEERGKRFTEVVSSMSSKWCAPAHALLQEYCAATAPEVTADQSLSTMVYTAVGKGPTGLLALADLLESESRAWAHAYWLHVALDAHLPLELYRIGHAMSRIIHHNTETTATAAAAVIVGPLSVLRGVQRCLGLLCEAKAMRAVGVAEGAWSLDSVAVKMSKWAVAEVCAQYRGSEDEDAMGDAMFLACCVHAAFRALLVDKASVAVNMRSCPVEVGDLCNVLAMTMNRTAGNHPAACLPLVTDMVEPPCAFYDNDLRVLMDVAMREITNAEEGEADKVLSYLELLSEVVQTEWFVRERHRDKELVSLLNQLSENNESTGIPALSRQVVLHIK